MPLLFGARRIVYGDEMRLCRHVYLIFFDYRHGYYLRLIVCYLRLLRLLMFTPRLRRVWFVCCCYAYDLMATRHAGEYRAAISFTAPWFMPASFDLLICRLCFQPDLFRCRAPRARCHAMPATVCVCFIAFLPPGYVTITVTYRLLYHLRSHLINVCLHGIMPAIILRFTFRHAIIYVYITCNTFTNTSLN